MRRWLVAHPFLVLGIITLLLFAAVEMLRTNGALALSRQLAGPMRLLIIPMYLMWLLVTMLNVALIGPTGADGVLRWIFAALQLVGGFAPYILADYLLGRWRMSRHTRTLAA